MLPDVLEVSRRVSEDYAVRYGDLPAFAGVYLSNETPVSAHPLEAVLTTYRQQTKVVREALPGKSILVSPYWDARLAGGFDGSRPEDIREGIRQIGRCGVDLIAPQDGRGVGKVGLSWPHQASDRVDPRVVSAAGNTTNAAAYRANTREYYAAARQGVADLAQEGLQVELWGNLEAFEPGPGVPCGSFTDIQRTTKERLDRAVMFAGLAPTKLISFMWDSLYTDAAGRPQPLADEIAADWRRPLVVDARLEDRDGRRGVQVAGYNLSGGEALFAWQVGDTHFSVRVPGDAAETATPSATHPLPPRLQTFWVPFDPPAQRVEVYVDAFGGQSTHAFSLEPLP